MTRQKDTLDFGRATRLMRAIRGMSQKELSAAAGLHPTYVSLIESGSRSPGLKTLKTIADTLDVPFAFFALLASGSDEFERLSEAERFANGLALFKLIWGEPWNGLD